MKKPYQKPLLYAESFNMSEHISAGCRVLAGEAEATYITTDSCAFIDRNWVAYQDHEGSVCYEAGMDLGLYNSFEAYIASVECYNAFTNANSMFVS